MYYTLQGMGVLDYQHFIIIIENEWETWKIKSENYHIDRQCNSWFREKKKMTFRMIIQYVK